MENKYLLWQAKLKAKKWLYVFCVTVGIYTIALVIVLGAVLFFSPYRDISVLAGAAFVVARLLVSPLINLFYKKQRPYQKYKFETRYSWLFSRKTMRENAFPSDHAISLSAIAVVFVTYLPSVGIATIILTLLNGYARIVLGYHDEKDILAGWALGIFCGWLVMATISKYILAA